ncbi:apolipoprotein C-I [Paramisgurnus dabryanus]|uniref:apolipoprotein C-I n=1 Tax=Paramisgurnus dabryanus TaxID=90735 RepID=UPI0031F426A2
MKLYLAAAVLMLVLAAHTEAQEDTLEQRFANFQNQMKDMTEDLAQKTKETFAKVENHEYVVKTKNWLSEQFEKVKQKMSETFN